MANFYTEMSVEAKRAFDTHLNGKRPYHRDRLLRTTVEKLCERCKKSFLAGGDYNPCTTGTWRKPLKARFCSKVCSSRSYGPTRYKLDPLKSPIAHPTMSDLAWAAGIYEGEGSVHGANVRHCITVTVAQKDPWLLHKLAALFGGRVFKCQPKSREDGRFSCDYIHRWDLGGARARGFAYTIFSFLSPRRRQQICKALISSNARGTYA